MNRTLERLPKIIEGLDAGLSRQQIADKLGVHRDTIQRDIRKWKKTGGYKEWYKQMIRRELEKYGLSPSLFEEFNKHEDKNSVTVNNRSRRT